MSKKLFSAAKWREIMEWRELVDALIIAGIKDKLLKNESLSSAQKAFLSKMVEREKN